MAAKEKLTPEQKEAEKEAKKLAKEASKKMTLTQRLLARSKVEHTAPLSESILYAEKDVIPTLVPMINVALSGRIDGGLTSGLTMLAGPSKHFKTSFALLMASAYLKQYPDAVLLFYDTEFGSPQSYFESFGIDISRVVHTPITNIEQLKFDLIGQLEAMDRDEKVIIILDSLGNSSSKKELDDVLEEKSVTDMTRAKSIKGLFRMVTPYLTLKNVPFLVVNHTYMTQEMFSKAIVSGGTGVYYSSDNIWIIGRRTEKDGTEVIGYNFIINIEKSRFVREKAKIPIGVSFTGGIQRWSGLLEVAEELGFVKQATKTEKGKNGKPDVVKPRRGYYVGFDKETQMIITEPFKEVDTLSKAFWEQIFMKTGFANAMMLHYSLGHVDMLGDDEMETAGGLLIDPKAAVGTAFDESDGDDDGDDITFITK
jgi:RecA/RadA recombinase